jgi:hypothetical protein
MPDDTEKARAEARLDAALAESAFQDPRPAYRDRLRWLREEQPKAFSTALAYYEETLVPGLVAGTDEPLARWIEYGRHLGELTAPGKTVAIDTSGRARPFRGAHAGDELILHLPNDTAAEALPLAVPKTMTAAQQANYDLLVGRARALG